MPQLLECPPPEIFALLLENRLPAAKRAETLLHIAGCNECAMAYSIAGAMRKKPVAKAKPFLLNPRYLSYAAVIFLLVGAGLIGRSFYAHQFSMEQYALSVEQPGAEQPRTEQLRAVQPRVGERRRMAEQPRAEESQARLAPHAQSAPPPPVVGYMPLQNQTLQAQRYRRPVRGEPAQRRDFDQSLYFSFKSRYGDRLPPDVWERYPASRESLKTLAWIAGLPEERKKEILALPPETAMREREKEEAQNMP